MYTFALWNKEIVKVLSTLKVDDELDGLAEKMFTGFKLASTIITSYLEQSSLVK